MRISRWLTWATTAVLALGAVAAAVSVAANFVLFSDYRPTVANGADGTAALPGVASTLAWVPREHRSLVVLFVASALATVMGLIGAAVSRRSPWIVATIMTTVALMAAAVAGVTRTAVQWDQLALTTVSVGVEIRGYNEPAFGSQVNFLLIDGHAVDPSDYQRLVIVHTAMPLLALIALLAALGVLLRSGGLDGQAVKRSTQAAISSTAVTASGNAG